MIAALFRRPDPGVCLCGCLKPVHEHYRPGSDCGSCGPDVCDRYRPDRRARGQREVTPVSADQFLDVLRTDQLIEAVEAGDIEHALLLAPAPTVALLVALRDLREVTR